ncbi:putative superfamily III holin-X [Myceligenerans xiligouense]|uniref:Putative superfamily III holin-X n=1 Tax=Myceligenerans xiligouense TaxID=253184 RepID=A0A3N4YMJ9_9MICO|nr:putative superfamily III holin-X [Myceligenerans xiligouense]
MSDAPNLPGAASGARPGAPRHWAEDAGPAADGVTSRADTTLPRTGVDATSADPPSAPPAGASAGGDDRSLGELIGEISRDLSTLVRQEAELAKAEIRQSAKRAGKGAGMFGGAGVAGHLVLLFLSLALWWWLGSLVGGGWSAVIVAAVWAIVAAALAMRGRSELRAVEGMPQTADSVKKIPQALGGHEEKNS